MTLIEELKRRNMFRVATVYGVASWVILQLSDILLPALGFAENSLRYILFVLVLGFPAVMIFSWMFEITPDGLRPTRQVDRTESISHHTARRIDFIIIGLLSLALAFFAFEYFKEPPEVTLDVATGVDLSRSLPANNASEPAPVDTRPSIAVLPFVNMSSDKENEHFSDGLSEELLNVLAQIDGLRVAGRTSSFFYKGKNQNLTDIGRALKVDNILEGSVRKSGNQIRITAQLISADDGFHLWSQTFDREVNDIFAIQDEISGHVANAMQLALMTDGVVLPESRLTDVPEAHDLYLRAKEALYRRTEDSVRQSIELFKQASQLDPEYAPPILGLADATMILQNNNQVMTLQESADIAKEALDRVAMLDFETSEYWSSVALYHSHLADFDANHYQPAADAFEKALALNENNVNAYMWYSSLLESDLIESNDGLALQLLEKALALDPLNRVANGNYQLLLAGIGNNVPQAIENLERLIKVDPEHVAYSSVLAAIHMNEGDFLTAVNVLGSMPAGAPARAFMVFRLLQLMNNPEYTEAFMSTLTVDNPVYEPLLHIHNVMNATLSELQADAEVLLLQPDYEGRGQPIAWRLYESGEYALALKVLENMAPALKGDITSIQYDAFNTLGTAMLLHHSLGSQATAESIANKLLATNRKSRYTGVNAKGMMDIFCYLVLGNPDRAIKEIQLAHEQGWVFYYGERPEYDPVFERIINDPVVREVRDAINTRLDAQRPAILKSLRKSGLLPSGMDQSI